MKRHFAIPVMIALAIEAVLLLCFNQPPAASAAPQKPPVPQPVTWSPADEPPPAVSPSEEPSGEPRNATPAPPAQPEPVPKPDQGRMTIETPPVTIPSDTPSSRIEAVLPGGIPGGHGGGSGIVGAEQLDNAPRVRYEERPRYPYEATRDRLSGRVYVEFSVDEGGRVFDARVVGSTNSVFEEPTIQAVRQWRFEPGRRHGKPVRFRMALPVEFRLAED
ncbi:MAG TPA: TonB family protein [Opitutaceae bacterium]|nr:TonB family protein [Opitutaceae bacterium]